MELFIILICQQDPFCIIKFEVLWVAWKKLVAASGSHKRFRKYSYLKNGADVLHWRHLTAYTLQKLSIDVHELNKKFMISPSLTKYSFPSLLTFPNSLAFNQPPADKKSE